MATNLCTGPSTTSSPRSSGLNLASLRARAPTNGTPAPVTQPASLRTQPACYGDGGCVPRSCAGRGAEGSVFFTVMPKSSVTTGTVIQNAATVVFDVNPPINTPTWSNTIDNTKPTSHVNPLAATQTTTSFTVSWAGTDAGD